MNNLNDIFFAPTASEELSYEQILEDVQRYFAENHAVAIAGEGDKGGELLQELMTQYLVKRRYTVEGLSTEELVERLYEDMAGYSFLKKWIYLTPGVEEVNINAYNDIEVIMNSGRSVKIPEKFSSPQHAIDVVRRMLSSCGMILDDTMPSVVGYLDKNIRISVDKTPIVDPDVGLNASIRIVNQQTVSKEKLLESGSATSEMLEFLTACIRYGVSVCIAGSTGSGKTTITRRLLQKFSSNVSVIYHDNYYKAHNDLNYEQRSLLNYDCPDAFDTELMLRDLKRLRAGEAIRCPVYDYTIHNRSDKTVLVKPSPVVIVEGILILQDPRLCELLDIKIFVDTDADVRILRRIVRDVRDRGRSLESVVDQYLTTVKPMHEMYVEPSKRNADIIIPEGGHNLVAMDMLIERIRAHVSGVQENG